MERELTIRVAALGALGSIVAACAPVADAEVVLSKGHQILLDRGLQLSALVYPEANGQTFSSKDWQDSGFTALQLSNFGGGDSSHNPQYFGPNGLDGYLWALEDHWGDGVPAPARPYTSGLFALKNKDEQDLTKPEERQASAEWFARMRQDPALDNVILYTNQFGRQIPEEDLKAHMALARPDMVSFDEYIFGSGFESFHKAGSPTLLYWGLAKYRKLGLAGNDGTGTEPLPYAHYTQLFTPRRMFNPESVRPFYIVSESEIRLDQFASWAFGYKMATGFTYDSLQGLTADSLGPVLFDGMGPDAPRTPQFDYSAQTNRESLRLGPALVSLLSRDIRIVQGPNSNGGHNVEEWAIGAGNDQFLKGVSATNLGTLNDGVRGDVLIGHFVPLVEAMDGPQYNGEQYFMIVNGLSWPDGSAEATAQRIHLDFDFADSGITGLERLSRLTGLVEDVSLVWDGGTKYHLDLVLPGGTGDLFKYDTGAPFVMAPEPSSLWVLGLGAVFLIRGRRRNWVTCE